MAARGSVATPRDICTLRRRRMAAKPAAKKDSRCGSAQQLSGYRSPFQTGVAAPDMNSFAIRATECICHGEPLQQPVHRIMLPPPLRFCQPQDVVFLWIQRDRNRGAAARRPADRPNAAARARTAPRGSRARRRSGGTPPPAKTNAPRRRGPGPEQQTAATTRQKRRRGGEPAREPPRRRAAIKPHHCQPRRRTGRRNRAGGAGQATDKHRKRRADRAGGGAGNDGPLGRRLPIKRPGHGPGRAPLPLMPEEPLHRKGKAAGGSPRRHDRGECCGLAGGGHDRRPTKHGPSGTNFGLRLRDGGRQRGQLVKHFLCQVCQDFDLFSDVHHGHTPPTRPSRCATSSL